MAHTLLESETSHAVDVLAPAQCSNQSSEALSLLRRNWQPKRLQHHAKKLIVLASKLDCDQAASESGLKILVITGNMLEDNIKKVRGKTTHVPRLLMSRGGNAAEPHNKWQFHSTIEADNSAHHKVVFSMSREHLAFQQHGRLLTTWGFTSTAGRMYTPHTVFTCDNVTLT